MALTATLDEMIASVRQQTDQLDSPFVTDAEITDWINQGILRFWQLLVTVAPDRGTITTTIATAAGTELYTLPSDFMSIRGLDYPFGGGDQAINILPYAFNERNQLNTLSGAWALNGEAPFRYRIVLGSLDGSGVRLSLRPDPGNQTLTLHYVAAPAPLTTGGDTFDGVVGLEQYPINWAARLIRMKAEEDASQEAATIALLEERIQVEAPRRDRSGQQTVAKVRNRTRFPYTPGYPI